MRVGIVALQHETNTFIAEPTGIDAFRGGLLATGAAFREAVEDSNHELAGFFAGLDEAGVTAVPLFGARGMPYGLVAGAAYAELKRRLLAEVRAQMPLDGLLLAPHGAGVGETAADLDGDWLQAVRALVGPRVPIIATGDPHVDQRERGLTGALRRSTAWVCKRAPHHLVGSRGGRVLNVLNQCTEAIQEGHRRVHYGMEDVVGRRNASFSHMNSAQPLSPVAAMQQCHDGLPISGANTMSSPDLFTHLLTESLKIGEGNMHVHSTTSPSNADRSPSTSPQRRGLACQ